MTVRDARTQPRPLVALVDPHASGHHEMYAAGYLRAIRELGCDVLLVLHPVTIASLPSDLIEAGCVHAHGWDATEVLQMAAPVSRRVAALWAALGRALDTAARSAGRYPDLVLHLYLDTFITEPMPPSVATRHVRCPVAGLWFKPPRQPARTWRAFAKRLIRCGRRYRLLRDHQFKAILLLDETAAHNLPGPTPRVVPVPEFTDVGLPDERPAILTSIMERARGRSICCLVGSIDHRKGVRDFLAAAAAAPEDDWFFVMAGQVAWQTLDQDLHGHLEKLVSEPTGMVMVHDEWLTEQALNAIIASSTLLHACYDDWPYSSNMLCKAAALGTPVIGRDEGYIGRKVRAYGLGFLVPRDGPMAAVFDAGFRPAAVAMAADRTFEDGCRRYLEVNDPRALVAALRPLLRELG